MRNQLATLRPDINVVDKNCNSGKIEEFQNNTLRPILNFQNSLILLIFQKHIEKYKVSFNNTNNSKRKIYIEKTIHSDKTLRYFLLGVVIGHFTNHEWKEYFLHRKELNRHILNLIIHQLQDQISNESLSIDYK